jgi:hypothetical protein
MRESFSLRDHRVIRRYEAGFSPAEIQDEIGGSRAAICVTLSRARKAGLLPKRADPVRSVYVPSNVYEQIRLEAKTRRTTPGNLVRRCLRSLSNDPRLFEKLLDR